MALHGGFQRRHFSKDRRYRSDDLLVSSELLALRHDEYAKENVFLKVSVQWFLVVLLARAKEGVLE